MKTNNRLIEKIKQIISTKGMISTGEAQPEASPFYGSLGDNITALVEEVEKDNVYIVVYDARTGNEIDSFYLPYDELPTSTLKEIKSMIEKYEPEEE